MAQAGFTPISLYFSSTAAAVPTSGNLVNGELALNTADMKLYAKNSAGVVTLLASSGGAAGTVSSVSGTGSVSGLTLTGTVTTSGSLTLGGTLSLVSPPPIGSTLPNTGAFSQATIRTTTNTGLIFNDTIADRWQIVNRDDAGDVLQIVFGNINSGGTSIANLTSTGIAVLGSLSSTTTASFAGGNFSIDANGSLATQGSTIATNVPNGAVGINTGPAGGTGLSLTNKAGNTANNTLRVIGIASQTSIVDVVNSASTSLFNILGNGAIGVNGASYGTAGQVLTSGGASAAPTWATAGGGTTMLFCAFSSTMGL